MNKTEIRVLGDIAADQLEYTKINIILAMNLEDKGLAKYIVHFPDGYYLPRTHAPNSNRWRFRMKSNSMCSKSGLKRPRLMLIGYRRKHKAFTGITTSILGRRIR